MRVFELTRQLIDIESITPNEYEVGEFLYAYLGGLAAKYHGKVERMPVEERRFNVLATSGRAVEAAGDVDVLLLDKTGTITLGDRQAVAFLPAPGVEERTLADSAQLASLSDAQAGEAYERLERLQAILDACRASLRVRVMRGDLPLPDGRVLRAVESAPRSLVVSKALPVLRSRVGDRADALVRQSLDAGVVGQLVRELHPGKGQRKHEEALWAELEAAGAVKTGSVTSLRRVAT